MANNNNKNVTLTQLTAMDTTVKNYIQSKDGDLVGLLTVDKSNLANAIKEIKNDLDDVNANATAIDTTVDGMVGGTTIAVSLTESEDTVEINGEDLVCKTYTVSQDDTEIATINVPIDLSVEEGAVTSEIDNSTGETTTYLKFKTTGANDYNLSLDVSSLVSGFSIQQDGILTLENGEITGEIVDDSVENSNIKDGNITEEKLSLGLQEKLAKEGYAERDVDVLDGEKDSLLALHKDKVNGKMTVAEEIAETIQTDIPLAVGISDGVEGNDGLMSSQDFIDLAGTYIDTVNNKLYIKGQEVGITLATDEELNGLLNEIFGEETTGGLTTCRIAFRNGYDEDYPTYVPNIIYSVGELIEVKDSSVIVTSQIITNFLQDMKDYYQQQYGEEEDFTLYGFGGLEDGSKILKLNDGYGHSGYWSIYKDTTTGKYYIQGSPYDPDYDKTVEAGCRYGSTDVMLSTVNFTNWINENMQEGYFDSQQMNFVLVELPEGGYTVAGRRNGYPGAPDPGSNYSLPECCKVESV